MHNSCEQDMLLKTQHAIIDSMIHASTVAIVHAARVCGMPATK